VNEYTRREEARWTFIASTVLVVCIAAAVTLIFTAKGRTIPDPGAQAAAKAADESAAKAKACAGFASRLATDVPIFLTAAKGAHLDAPEPDPKKPPPKKPRKGEEPDAVVAWGAAAPVHKDAVQVAPCRERTDAVIGARPDTVPGWEAIAGAAAIAVPGEGDKAAQIEAAKTLYEKFKDASVDAVLAATQDAERTAKASAEAEAARAAKSTVIEALPAGLLSRETAIAIGVAIAIVALLVSYLSVKAASTRRMLTLVPLRDLARTPQRGLQAAAILRLAAAHNGGEPGLVIGAAVGGLLAAAAFRTDGDLFVAGVMGGLLVGLGVQWLFRLLFGLSRWRARAAELGEIEKPTIPIVLVLSGVNEGLEAQFLRFFDGLPPGDAAATVDRLATQAEERILAAADAGAGVGPRFPVPPPAHGYPPGGLQ